MAATCSKCGRPLGGNARHGECPQCWGQATGYRFTRIRLTARRLVCALPALQFSTGGIA